ncbi:MAG: hypothetical protein IJT36_08660 [Alphaproteobacteria bacterium]|nr:hypothetical protein [Alphaproteobacteria bacterium]
MTTQNLKGLVPENIENINQISKNKSIFPNVCFVLALCFMIFVNFLMFRSFTTWMAPLVIFLLEMFIIEILSKLLKITEAPVIIRILLHLLKDKGLE